MNEENIVFYYPLYLLTALRNRKNSIRRSDGSIEVIDAREESWWGCQGRNHFNWSFKMYGMNSAMIQNQLMKLEADVQLRDDAESNFLHFFFGQMYFALF